MIVQYIDPGTGSMLFSLLIGFATVLYFLLKAAWIKIKFSFSGGKTKRYSSSRKSIVIYSEHKRYWSVFQPIVDSFEAMGFPVEYLTSSEDDPIFTSNYSFIKASYIGTGNKAFAKLNFLEADICLMTTPGLDVYQLKRSRGVKHYSHILHAVGDATGYRLFGLDYFDSVLLNGSYQIEDIRTLEKQRGIPEKDLVVVGCPYLDYLEERIQSTDKSVDTGALVVLVAPSWGASGILSRYGETLLDPLVKTGFTIIVRPHPQSFQSEKNIIERLQTKYEGYANVQWNSDADNIGALGKADVLISDYSSVMFDYVFLFNRPLLYLNASFDIRPYDAGDIERLPWKLRVLPEIGIELTESAFGNIKDVIVDATTSRTLQENREKAKLLAWEHRGESGERTARFLMEKLTEIAPNVGQKGE